MVAFDSDLDFSKTLGLYLIIHILISHDLFRQPTNKIEIVNFTFIRNIIFFVNLPNANQFHLSKMMHRPQMKEKQTIYIACWKLLEFDFMETE